MAEKKRKPSAYNLHVRDFLKANPGATMAEAAAAYKGRSDAPSRSAGDDESAAAALPQFVRGHIRRRRD